VTRNATGDRARRRWWRRRRRPRPGSLGAVEAALVAGLTSVGVDKEVAVPAVFPFRLATFWLRVLPGYLAFRHLTRREML
jgi:uncharacterized membrane protein YbhN (UPF0104 family)